MKKYKELIKNLGFFLIPLYTAVLTTEEYGSYDFIFTTISLLVPLLTLNISEAALRFLIEKKNSKSQIINITIKYNLLSIFIIFIFVILNYLFNFIELFNTYVIYFILMYVCNLIYVMMQNIIRGMDRLNDIAVSGIINSIFTLGLNLIFLLYFKIGLTGYFLSTIFANFIASLFLFFKIDYKSINLKDKIDPKVDKEMRDYGKPLALNSIAWWINSVSDRYFVTFICGLAVNGVYSISYKIPSILSMFQSIFNQAWVISAAKEYDKNDSNNFFSNTYKSYNYIMVICCSLLIIFAKIIAKFLYLKDFYSAWIYTPFLLLSCVFGANSGFFGGVFSAVKNSKIIGVTTLIGALLNIVFNFILVIIIGPLGAAISTAFSYFVVWIIRLIYVKKYINFKISLYKDIFVYLLLLIQSILILTINSNIVIFMEIIIFAIINVVYYKNIKFVLKKLGGKNG